jgi:hypothetical protein
MEEDEIGGQKVVVGLRGGISEVSWDELGGGEVWMGWSEGPDFL